jgi:DNA repair protein RecN (Recombination protein N)
MLERLVIRDLALVERAEICFGPGLNAMTGETGAGKSLVVQAVNLIVGERAEADVVRQGAAAAVVEAEFRLAGEIAARVGKLLGEWDLEFDGETLVVRREVAAGRSRASVNQSPVTLASLKRLGELLADLHGQHEHQSLLRPEAGLATLDRLARLEAERLRFAESLAAWREAEADLERVRESLATFAERRDYLQHAGRELVEAGLQEGEDETLARDAARLAHVDRLRVLVSQAIERLSEAEGAAIAGLGAATHAIEQAAALDPGLEDSLPSLREATIAAGEAARTLADYWGRLEADPQALEAIEARRDLIAKLVRKYRRDVPELVAWQSEIEHELAAGEDAEGTLLHAGERVAAARGACLALGQGLGRRRREAAGEWSARLTRELKPLGLGAARLEFAVLALEGDPGPAGLDQVALLFTPNPGEPPRPLQRIASGGELSRVMLAIKVALEALDRVDLLIFDEVDSGIGGAVAQAVGERLRRLARHRPIVCVTHLPLIAALARHHLRVTKHVHQGRTVVRVEPVEGEARVAEIARMLAGERVTETTRRQARELLDTTV